MSELLLTRSDSSNISELLQWVPERDDLRAWSGTYFSYPLTSSQLLDHSGRLENAGHLSLSFFGSLENGEAAAYGEICEIQRGASAMLRRILVRPGNFRRKGYREKFVGKLLNIAFREYEVHRVYLGVFEFNEAAIALYRKLNFTHEGAWREHVRDGEEFLTLNWMGILRAEWDKQVRAKK